uniref:Odorant binding protein 27b n=1 Tax=Heliconius charithonia TaxID=33434 RepID=A0AA49EZW4_HELCH|nr:odorant binding protein 27b [Heliconius charithonia]
MNTLWCFLFLSIALVNGKSVFIIPPEYAGDILKATADCINSTGTGVGAIQKILSGTLENSEPFKKFLYCFSFKSGYIDSNGHFNLDKMTSLIGNHKDKAKYIDVINQCNKSKGGSTLDTVYEISLCFKENTPIYFSI